MEDAPLMGSVESPGNLATHPDRFVRRHRPSAA